MKHSDVITRSLENTCVLCTFICTLPEIRTDYNGFRQHEARQGHKKRQNLFNYLHMELLKMTKSKAKLFIRIHEVI